MVITNLHKVTNGGFRQAAKLMYECKKTIKKSLSIEISKKTTLLCKFCRMSRSASDQQKPRSRSRICAKNQG